MTDTPQAIKDLQLKIWLSKTPGERLHQMMKDNEELINFWKQVRQVPEEENIISNQLPSKEM